MNKLVVLAVLAVGGFFLYRAGDNELRAVLNSVYRATQPDSELQAAVKAVSPKSSDELECSWESDGGSLAAGASKSYYGCLYRSSGDVTTIGLRLTLKAVQRGFTISCRSRRSMVAIVARRGRVTLFADIRAGGFAPFRIHHLIDSSLYGDVVAPSDIQLTAHTVLVDISAHKDPPDTPLSTACAI